jgi:hypothetical protein
MAAFYVSAGPQTGSTFSQAAKMTSFPSGRLLNRLLLRGVKDISPGSPLCASTLGAATIGTIGLAAWEKTAGSYCGISA